MKLQDYKKDDGYELDGCSYVDAGDLLQTGILGFCGCGDPEANLLYVLRGLELIGEDGPEWDSLEFGDWCEKHKARIREHFKSEAAEYFFYYWADKEGLTEHGGSVPGWLDQKGKDLLSMLIEWRNSRYVS